MEHQFKAQILKDIMKAMLERDGNRLRPKPAATPVAETPRVENGKDMAPGMAHGGEVLDPHDHLHEGAESDMSPEDAHILEQLWDKGDNHEHAKLDSFDDDEDDDEDAGRD